MLFIINKLDVIKLESVVISMHTTKEQAVNKLYDIIEDIKGEQIVLEKMKDNSIISVFHKNRGFLYDSKHLIERYRIQEFIPQKPELKPLVSPKK